MTLLARWVLAFAIGLGVSPSLLAQGDGKPPQATASDGGWWANDDRPDGITAPRYAGAVRSSRYVGLRDGVRLAVDVYLPAGLEAGARLPAILEQTRYRRSFEFQPDVRATADQPPARVTAFVTRGYAYVIVDVRGTGASFGSRPAELGRQEVRDGREVVDWIVGQPWSNGKVGATGVSYVGTTAELLLVNRHPAVKAIVPQFSLFDAYADIAFPGGVRLAWFITTWAQAIGAMDRNEIPEQQRRQIAGVRPVDADSDRALLGHAIREHATNIAIDAELAPIAYRDDRAPAGCRSRPGSRMYLTMIQLSGRTRWRGTRSGSPGSASSALQPC